MKMKPVNASIRSSGSAVSIGALACLTLLTTPLQAGHGFGASCGFAGPYGGRPGWFHHGGPICRTPAYVHPYSYSHPYSWSYPNGYYGSYGYYGGHAYFSPVFGYRPFPYSSPRIYVVPQRPPNPFPGPRRIIILNLGQSEPSEVDGPDPGVNPFAGEAAYPPPPPKAQAADPDKAWDYLESGDARMALHAFTSLASRQPDQGEHQVGFGLAAALLDDKFTAAYALRRAFESDPAGAGRVTLGDTLRERASALARAYEADLRKNPANVNLRFLCAVTLHLARNDDAARTLLAESIHRFQESAASTANLLRLLEQPAPSIDLVRSGAF